MASPLTVADRIELTDLVARYAVAVDSRDFASLRDIFVPECTLDTGRAVRDGIDAVLEAMQGLLRYEATSHVIGQQVVNQRVVGESDDGVDGLVYCTAHHLTDHGDHRTDKVMHIRYHDRYTRTDAGWRIAARRLELVWSDETSVGAKL
jgi:hypothetical protein